MMGQQPHPEWGMKKLGDDWGVGNLTEPSSNWPSGEKKVALT
jgi:hypothetical protein